MMCITIHLFSTSSSLFFYFMISFFGHGVRYSLPIRLCHACTAYQGSLEPCTYIWKVFFFLFSLASMHQSVPLSSSIILLLASRPYCHFFPSFCVYLLYFLVALCPDCACNFAQKITLWQNEIFHGMPRKSLDFDALLQSFSTMPNQAVNLWVILQAHFLKLSYRICFGNAAFSLQIQVMIWWW